MSLTDNAAFSPRTVAILIVVSMLAFAGAAFFIVFGDHLQTSGANSFSKSAIGHKAFVELLSRQDIPVIVSRSDSARKARGGSLLVVAEPLLSEIEKHGGMPKGTRTLVVLPKWRGLPDRERPGWIAHAVPLPKNTVEDILQIVLPGSAVARPTGSVSWNKVSFRALHAFRHGWSENDQLWDHLQSYEAPFLEDPQLIVSQRLIPIIASPDGILVGGVKQDDGWLFVISDPDLLSNHGIGQGDNAARLLDLLSLFKPTDTPVIVDETMHGFRASPNLWRKIFELPFIVPTILTMAAIIVLLLAATGRFGAPRPAGRAAERGETGLIENAVDLLYQAGHGTAVAQRYPAVVLREVAQRLHMPRGLREPERLEWIDRVSAARGIGTGYRALLAEIETVEPDRRAATDQTLQTARRLFQWKQEMLDGPGRGTND